ncbi:DoxX family protein [Paenibacillus thalictri]|uniref:DoxX family protein n=1 Tax=Paenibacillus thalictri TaxID=2527873 RepID=A0A4Q9DI31_9BACL|nr:DoxX family protein [Paenibacillus thalictri]TBL70736.1 DoxX family protein [Paenibacillus thalictri]
MDRSVGTSILRIVLGITFLVHGFAKFETFDGIAGWFVSIGLPSFMPYLVTGVEILGGIGLILGFGTRLISVVIILLMAGAIFKVKLAVGFLGDGKMAGYELDLALLVMALHLALSGSYTLSLDGLLRRDKETSQDGRTI